MAGSAPGSPEKLTCSAGGGARPVAGRSWLVLTWAEAGVSFLPAPLLATQEAGSEGEPLGSEGNQAGLRRDSGWTRARDQLPRGEKRGVAEVAEWRSPVPPPASPGGAAGFSFGARRLGSFPKNTEIQGERETRSGKGESETNGRNWPPLQEWLGGQRGWVVRTWSVVDNQRREAPTP